MNFKNKVAMEIARALMVKTISTQGMLCEYALSIAIGDKRFTLNESDNKLMCYDILMDEDIDVSDILMSYLTDVDTEKSIEVRIDPMEHNEEYEYVRIFDESHLTENEIIAVIKSLYRVCEYEQIEYTQQELLDIFI